MRDLEAQPAVVQRFVEALCPADTTPDTAAAFWPVGGCDSKFEAAKRPEIQVAEQCKHQKADAEIAPSRVPYVQYRQDL